MLDLKLWQASTEISALSQELAPLLSYGPASLGNQGLFQTTSLIFNPLTTLFNVATYTKLLGTSVGTLVFEDLYNSWMSNNDTVSSFQGLLYESSLH